MNRPKRDEPVPPWVDPRDAQAESEHDRYQRALAARRRRQNKNTPELERVAEPAVV